MSAPHSSLIDVDGTERHQCRILFGVYSGQACDVHAFVATLAPEDSRMGSRFAIPDPYIAVQTCAGKQLSGVVHRHAMDRAGVAAQCREQFSASHAPESNAC